MRLALINTYYRTTPIHGMGTQVPLGLLMIGSPLIDKTMGSASLIL